MKRTFVKTLLAATAVAAAAVTAPAPAGETLDAIKARGQLVCGVDTGLAGFSAADSQGRCLRASTGTRCRAATPCR